MRTVMTEDQKKIKALYRMVFTSSVAAFRMAEEMGNGTDKSKAMRELHESMLEVIGWHDAEKINDERFFMGANGLLYRMELLAGQPEKPHDFESGGIIHEKGGISVGCEGSEFVPRFLPHDDIGPDTTNPDNWPNIISGKDGILKLKWSAEDNKWTQGND